MRTIRRRRSIRVAALALLGGVLVATTVPAGSATLAFDEETNPGKPTCSLCEK
jgi:hypothetical protein